MTEGDFDYNYEVGKQYGRSYQIGVRADPSLNTVESFAAVLYYEKGNGERLVVARIDDTPHPDAERDIHIDRLYREEGAEVKAYDIDVENWHEANRYLGERWREFAQRYESNHGEKR